jgi:hypothetical protein
LLIVAIFWQISLHKKDKASSHNCIVGSSWIPQFGRAYMHGASPFDVTPLVVGILGYKKSKHLPKDAVSDREASKYLCIEGTLSSLEN